MSEIQIAILCKKCKEVLNSQDDIFGTSCGHLYHFLCLRECHGRSAKCTDCDAYKPSMFKMFLDFGKTPMSSEDQMKTIQLHNILEESQSTINCLEEKEKIAKSNIQKLEGKLKKLDDAVKTKNSIISDLEDRLSALEELNKYLNTENEQKNKTSIANESSEKVLQLLKAQLEAEVEKNTKFAIENMKLKSIICATNNEDYLTGISQNPTEEQENEISSDDMQIDENSDSSKEQITENIPENSSCNNCKVSICNYSKNNLKYPLIRNIKDLAFKMKLPFNINDIQEVEKIQINENNIILIVLFRNEKLKKDFIRNKNILQKFKITKNLEICE